MKNLINEKTILKYGWEKLDGKQNEYFANGKKSVYFNFPDNEFWKLIINDDLITIKSVDTEVTIKPSDVDTRNDSGYFVLGNIMRQVIEYKKKRYSVCAFPTLHGTPIDTNDLLYAKIVFFLRFFTGKFEIRLFDNYYNKCLVYY